MTLEAERVLALKLPVDASTATSGHRSPFFAIDVDIKVGMKWAHVYDGWTVGIMAFEDLVIGMTTFICPVTEYAHINRENLEGDLA